jgi:hypothetical protein
LYKLANANTKLNTNQRQTIIGKHQAQRNLEKFRTPNMTRSRMLGEGNEKPTPIDIWERGNGFGEWEYLYPLPSIFKPYFACNLSPMITSLRKCLIPTFIWFDMGVGNVH